MHTLSLLILFLALPRCVLGQAARRIAIVGGGPAGAASAYFARDELQQRSIQADIHVFERLPRLGGRAHAGTIEHANRTLYYEQGASMFIGKNLHMVDLARRFNLTLCPHPCTLHPADTQESRDDPVVDAGMLGAYGIWDPLPGPVAGPGRWAVRRHGDQPLRDMLRALWRYGGLGDLRRVRGLTSQAVDQFMQSYGQFARPGEGIYASWDAYLADRPALQQALYYRAAELYSHGSSRISQRFLREVVSLATRVNYMQDVDVVSAMGAHISMAAESDEAFSVAGGNFQVFDRMLGDSADVHLGCEVVSVEREGSAYRLVTKEGPVDGTFDTVIVAAPLPLTRLRLPDGLGDAGRAAEVEVEYVRMHVTFVIGRLRADLFPADGLRLLRLVVTPYGTTQPFNCLSFLACLDGAQNCGRPDGLALFKLFSHTPIDLDRVFAHVQWHRRNTWHAYPRLEPRNGNKYAGGDDSGAFSLSRKSLPPIVLDRVGKAGVFYVNGMEAIFSTMESQTVAARHVVRLALFGDKASV